MSAIVKLNVTLLTASLSAILAGGSVIWYAAAKAASIDEVRMSLSEAVRELKQINNTVQQLDARYGLIAKQVDGLEGRMHGIATSIGMRAAK